GNTARSETIQFDFNSAANLEYNYQYLEVYQSQLRLSPTGFWTNTTLWATSVANSIDILQNSKNHLFYAGFSPTSFYGVYKSTNYGAIWTLVSETPFRNMVEKSNGTLFIAPGFSLGGRYLLRSTDDGDTWQTNLAPGSYSGCVFIDNQDDLYFWQGGRSGGIGPVYPLQLLKSTNNGLNWFTNVIFTTNESGPNIMLELNNGNFLYAGGNLSNGNGLFLSTNRGTNWKFLNALSNYYCQDIFYASDHTTLYAVSSSAGIRRSVDQGMTWQVISTQECNSLIESSDGIFYSTRFSNVWKSFDRGYNWQKTPYLCISTTNYYNVGALLEADNGKIYTGAVTSLGAFPWEACIVFYNGYPAVTQCTLYASPSVIKQWESFTKDDAPNGGSISYDMAYSTDGGGTWSSWVVLNDANLQSVPCVANGDDRLRIRITFNSVNHISNPEIDTIKLVYASGIGETVDNVVVAPNPYIPGTDGPFFVTFYNLPSYYEMKVFSISGGEIFFLAQNNATGRFYWDVKNNEGQMIKSGVYVCHFKDRSGHEKTLKLVVVR
ncbi:MAG: exo-alpha-sialidase, partial [Spirochaetes bacterium]|nr:exo-alpha-sialidase [Spirochaetota bacterium]